MNHQCQKIKNKSEEKETKEKVLSTYEKQLKDWCSKYGKCGHKSTDQKRLGDKKEDFLSVEKMNRGVLSVRSMVRKSEKTEKALDKAEDNLVL